MVQPVENLSVEIDIDNSIRVLKPRLLFIISVTYVAHN